MPTVSVSDATTTTETLDVGCPVGRSLFQPYNVVGANFLAIQVADHATTTEQPSVVPVTGNALTVNIRETHPHTESSTVQTGLAAGALVVSVADSTTTGDGVLAFPYTGNAPTAVTLQASGVTPTSAFLNGSVNPNGNETSFFFAWGTTELYGNSTPLVPLGNGMVPTTVGETLGSTVALPTVAQFDNAVTDPGFEYDPLGSGSPAGWGAGANAPSGQVSNVWAASGFQSFSLVTPTLSNTAASTIFPTQVFFTGPLTGVKTQLVTPISGGQSVSVSAAVNVTAITGSMAISMSIQFFSGTGASLGTFQASNAITTTGVATTSGTVVAPTNATTFTSTVNAVAQANNSSASFYLDDVLVAPGATTVPPYFDGDTLGYEWAGTPGNSVTFPVPILVPGTIYHYAVVAQFPGGNIFGQDESFVAQVAPLVTDPSDPLVSIGAGLPAPHFAYPLTINPTGAIVVDQGSEAEVASCVTAIVDCPEGACPELADFGIPDLTFRTLPMRTADLVSIVTQLEPRVDPTAVTAAIGRPEQGAQNLILSSNPVGVTTE